MASLIVIRPKTSFRRGLGAASFRNPYWGGMPPVIPSGGVAVAPSFTSASSATPTNTATANGYSRRGRRGWANPNQGYSGGSPSNIPPWQQGASQSTSQTASAATMAAFNAALANAVAYGVISTTGAAQLQSQTSGATDATVQALTAQINQLLATTPSAASTAAGATVAPATAVATSTSWWDGSTTLFGSTISNSTLAIGAGLAAVALWAAFKKK